MGIIKDLFKGDKVVWIIFLFFCLISIIEVFSAASTLVYNTGNHWQPIRSHSLFLMVGAVIVVVTHNVPCRFFQRIPLLLFPLSVILLFIVPFLGKVNGASRWMDLFGVRFQPSEFGKMAVVLTTAYILSRFRDEQGATQKAFQYILCLNGLIIALIFPENFSTAIILALVVFMMMIIGKVSSKLLVKTAGGALIAVFLAVGTITLIPVDKLSKNPITHRVGTWQGRIKNFFDDKTVVPASKFDTRNNAQVAHANIAIASSHILGKMPGNSVQRDFLPQAYSDFIFAIIIEELGLAGGIVVVLLYICLLTRIGRIAKRSKKLFPAYLVMGIGLLFVLQAMINMMVSVGLFPVTGQPLPLISRGGTSIIINCIYIGMVLSVSRYVKEKEDEEKQNQLLANEEKLKEATEVLLVHAKEWVAVNETLNKEEELLGN
ncbi:MAG: FtsW/RodA/SpoVE family cell cycle protein [Phocaeicola sp.]